MSYLLDTHYLIWAIVDSKKISKKLRELISNAEQEIFVSTISFWEVALKSSIGKIDISGFHPEDIPELCTKIGFDIIELSAADSSSYHLLKASHHKDPFDRMLIWQAIRNGHTLISADVQIKKYRSEGLSILERF
jgi:PIN domain nuclease of toxin-antitoxin system